MNASIKARRFSQAVAYVLALATLAVFFTGQAGCTKDSTPPAKAPRPVTIIDIYTSVPKHKEQVAGSVGSWKTEQIGFEVAGRVLWVLEPNANIEGRLLSPTGEIVTEGTELAKLDDERFRLSVESAQTQVKISELQKTSTKSDIKAAEADEKLAKLEYERYDTLVKQNAAAQAELDRAEATLQSSSAKLATLNTSLEQADQTITRNKQSLKEAELNLEDTILYSSFRGQVADVHVVPGSVVAQGEPVLTIQMMDPIKVELEVSAASSRTLQRKGSLPVAITLADGSEEVKKGYVYMVDAAADSSTRTFTVTLLMLNSRVQLDLPGLDEKTARTVDIWPVKLEFLPAADEGLYYIEEGAIHKDDEGHFVWRITNYKFKDTIRDPKLAVEKLRIEPTQTSIPFLGNWAFRTVKVPGEFDPEKELVVGKLEVPEGMTTDEWNGEEVYLDDGGQWMLRPGDVVTVDVSGQEAEAGFYAPVEAVYESAGKTFIFVAQKQGGDNVDEGDTVNVKKVEVSAAAVERGEFRRLEVVPTSDGDQFELNENNKLIVGGLHYTNDGEEVRVIEKLEQLK